MKVSTRTNLQVLLALESYLARIIAEIGSYERKLRLIQILGHHREIQLILPTIFGKVSAVDAITVPVGHDPASVLCTFGLIKSQHRIWISGPVIRSSGIRS